MSNRDNVAVLSPGFPPAYGGGAPIYTDLLVRGLARNGFPGRLFVFTERFRGQSKVQELEDGKIRVMRIFPDRSAAPRNTLTRYPKYAIQNLQFVSIRALIEQYNIGTVLVHSNFHNKPGILHKVLGKAKQKHGTKLIADMRETKLALDRIHRLYPYDAVVCCSQSVYNHFSCKEQIKDKLTIIPIPMPPDIGPISDEKVAGCVRKYGLEGKRFLFSATGISREKGIDLALDVARKLRDYGEDISVVVAGKKRDWDAVCDTAEREGVLRYIGVLRNKDMLACYQASELVINFSHVEGMPRSCLEAMSIGAKVLLPQGVPEFAESCPERVMVSNNPSELASQVLELMSGSTTDNSSGYDLSQHQIDRVATCYKALIRDIVTECGFEGTRE